MSNNSRFDVVVIGGGFAGLIAARDLTDQGNTVLLVDAHDYLGGRAWGTVFPSTDIPIGMGGQFILDGGWPEMMNAQERYGIETHHVPPPDSYPTVLSGGRNPGPAPVSFEQFWDLERAILHCQQASARIAAGTPLDQQELADLDIPLSEFLAPLGLSTDVFEYVTTVAGLYGFRYPEESSALQILTTLACCEQSVLTLYSAVDAYIHTGSLAERIAADITEVRLECPVARVDQTGDDVVVTTAAGEVLTASAVVVATPMNTWNDIEFVPPLSETKRATSAERHGTERGAKVWMRVRNAPEKPFVFAAPQAAEGALALYTEGQFDNGDDLMAMFGYASIDGDSYHLDFDDRDSVVRTLQTLLPGAELVEFISHNHAADQYTKGGWVSWRPGRVSNSHSALAAPEGRLAFATADIAPKWLMMIEGAMESGRLAAQHTQTLLPAVAAATP